MGVPIAPQATGAVLARNTTGARRNAGGGGNSGPGCLVAPQRARNGRGRKAGVEEIYAGKLGPGGVFVTGVDRLKGVVVGAVVNSSRPTIPNMLGFSDFVTVPPL